MGIFRTARSYSTGDQLTASILNTELKALWDGLQSAWDDTFTPTLLGVTTNPTLGSGSHANCRFHRVGATIRFEITFIFGTSGTNKGSGIYDITLPVAALYNANTAVMVGNAYLFDSSTGNIWQAQCRLQTGSPPTLRVYFPSTIFANPMGDSVPAAWGQQDQIRVWGTYEAAP